MNDGYWKNYNTQKVFKINEHEMWIRDINNARKLGISDKTIDSFDKYKQSKDRDAFLVYIMRENPVMRIRGHGVSITFEFNSKSFDIVLKSIAEFCKKDGIGDYMMLNIFNFADNKRFNCLYKDFDGYIKSGMIIRMFTK